MGKKTIIAHIRSEWEEQISPDETEQLFKECAFEKEGTSYFLHLETNDPFSLSEEAIKAKGLDLDLVEEEDEAMLYDRTYRSREEISYDQMVAKIAVAVEEAEVDCSDRKSNGEFFDQKLFEDVMTYIREEQEKRRKKYIENGYTFKWWKDRPSS